MSRSESRQPNSRRRTRIAIAVLGTIVAIAIFCPLIAPYDPTELPDDTLAHQFRAPLDEVVVFEHEQLGEKGGVSWSVEGDELVLDPARGFDAKRYPVSEIRRTEGEIRPVRTDLYLLGTDREGRDLLSRMLYGTRVSLVVGLAAMLLAVTIGTTVGALAGYFGGVVDGALMRLVDVLIAFPRLVLLLVIATLYEQGGMWTVVLVLGATGWMGVARLVRAEFLRLRELDYTWAARALGATSTRTIFRHILPNAAGPITVVATLRVADAILLEAALSFLGFGVAGPTPTWGNIIESGRSALLDGVWWVSTLPGLLIVVTVLAVNTLATRREESVATRPARS